MDAGEDVLTACTREVLEETGITINTKNTTFKISTINHHKDKGIIWVIYGFKTVFSERPEVISSEEGECKWYKISELMSLNIVPPVLGYINTITKSDKTIFTCGTYENGELINRVANECQ